MNSNYVIYQKDASEEIPVQDESRLDGYLYGKFGAENWEEKKKHLGEMLKEQENFS